ncbi:outer membrane protein transport protein [Balneolales bacterium ANBcel1]|nr:outer membrane protein transport protein [Balneolales bacterium ANBcel1]
MKNFVTVIAIMLLTACMGVKTAWAGGYQLNLSGQRQVGMAYVGTGMPLDLATISMNPGGLAALDHNGILLGSNATFINTTFRSNPQMFPVLQGDYEAETDSRIRTPFSIYAAYETPLENLRAGLGVYTPYGNNVRWDNDWLYAGMLTEITMFTIFIQPTLSYSLTERLSVGAGPIFAIGSVNLQRRPTVDLRGVDPNLPQDAPLHVELDGSTTAFGFNAGLYYEHNDMLSFGVSYRSKVDMELEEGDADFTLESQQVPAAVAGQLFPPGNTFDASLPLPAVLSLGLGIRPSEVVRIGLDANLTFWSEYEDLSFDFGINTPAVQDSQEPRNFNDRWIFRVGGEWDATEVLQLRLGAYYDMSPVDEGFITPETPDVDRYGFSAGASVALTPQMGLNASVLFITSSYREQTLEDMNQPGTPAVVPVGEFQTNALIPGLSFYYNF